MEGVSAGRQEMEEGARKTWNCRRICAGLQRTVTVFIALVACLLLLILHSFAVFHARVRLDSKAFAALSNVSVSVSASASARIMYALREEGSRAAKKPVKPEHPVPPLNASQEQRTKWFRDNRSSFKILQADSLSEQFPARAKAFFKPCKLRFFMTWISSAGEFGRRERLSLESLFKAHPRPSTCVLIMSRSLDSDAGAAVLRPFAAAGFRVLAAAPDLRYLLKNTDAEPWLRDVENGDIDPGEISFAQNLSNILRLAALYKFGGIYIDTDVIVLRSFSVLRNAIGAQNRDPQTGQWNRLNNAILVFDKRHPLLAGFIREFALTFDGNKWGHNGPYLVTRVLSRLLKAAGDPPPDRHCVVLPPMAFYPVDWTRIYRFFSAPPDDPAAKKWRAAKILQLENESYAIHLWNKQSRHLNVERGSIIHHFFARRCIFCHFYFRTGPVL